MQKVKEICEQLQATNGRIEKEQILKDNTDNEDFKYILNFLLDTNITTGVSEAKIKKIVPSDESYMNFIQLLEYVKENNTGTDNVLSEIHSFLNYQPFEMQDFYKSILTKSLKLGLDVKTVNKVYGDNFVFQFDVMLGTSIEKCKIPEDTYFYISHKLNGSRALFYKGDLYTRSGKKYTGVEHIINDLKRVSINPNIVVDGELVRKNVDNKSDSENFQIGVGIANSKAETKEELKLVIFDIITVNDFENGKSKLTYSERKPEIEALRETVQQLNIENLSVVDMFYEGTDQTQIWKWLDYAEEHDLEGVIVNLDTPYECKRTKNLIKVKLFKEIELRCIDIKLGGGKYKNQLGSIVCKYKNNIVEVGSGFNDKQREYYWNNKLEIINKIISIKYKEITKNKNGMYSLQFPIFQTIRFDKDIADDE